MVIKRPGFTGVPWPGRHRPPGTLLQRLHISRFVTRTAPVQARPEHDETGVKAAPGLPGAAAASDAPGAAVAHSARAVPPLGRAMQRLVVPVALCVASLFAAAVSTPLQAQDETPVRYVSNSVASRGAVSIGSPPSTHSPERNVQRTQRFTTGTREGGYKLSMIRFYTFDNVAANNRQFFGSTLQGYQSGQRRRSSHLFWRPHPVERGNQRLPARTRAGERNSALAEHRLPHLVPPQAFGSNHGRSGNRGECRDRARRLVYHERQF